MFSINYAQGNYFKTPFIKRHLPGVKVQDEACLQEYRAKAELRWSSVCQGFPKKIHVERKENTFLRLLTCAQQSNNCSNYKTLALEANILNLKLLNHCLFENFGFRKINKELNFW